VLPALALLIWMAGPFILVALVVAWLIWRIRGGEIPRSGSR